jgi:Tol biopolymer transport system component
VDFTPRAWAPNGTLLAVSVVSDEDPTRMGLNLAPLDGSPGWSIQVTGAYDEFPITFSPDSRRLLFLRASQEGVGALMEGTLEPSTDGSGTFGLAVRQVSPAGWTVRQDDYIGPAASYSPDGSRIVFVADDGQGAQLYVVDAAGGTPESIAGPASGLTTAAWSPDGSWIAFDGSINGAAHDVYAVHPDGSGQVDLTAELGLGACCARWSPDSQALLVQATATDDQHAYLFIVAIHDGQTWQVTTVPSLYENVSWGPAPG